ncbi:MAG: hypothetical protein EBS65_25565, partial [Betaproteobacteria bacterium]|nr:hypothetical protein [Betaproteobacteria bacterium]
LLKLELKVTRLPVARSGTAALKPFGYDLFEQAHTTLRAAFLEHERARNEGNEREPDQGCLWESTHRNSSRS